MDKAAARLSYNPQRIRRWLAGDNEPPAAVIFKAVMEYKGPAALAFLIAGIVDVDEVPDLAETYRLYLQQLAFQIEQPLTIAIWVMLGCSPVDWDAAVSRAAKILRQTRDSTARTVKRMETVGMVRRQGRTLVRLPMVDSALTDFERTNKISCFWASLAAEAVKKARFERQSLSNKRYVSTWECAKLDKVQVECSRGLLRELATRFRELSNRPDPNSECAGDVYLLNVQFFSPEDEILFSDG